MALATTCPQCMTSFRVVPDQLKLRRGLVRCGTCRNVFSGVDYLRYVDDARLRAPGGEPLGADAPVTPEELHTALRVPESIVADADRAEPASRGGDESPAPGDGNADDAGAGIDDVEPAQGAQRARPGEHADHDDAHDANDADDARDAHPTSDASRAGRADADDALLDLDGGRAIEGAAALEWDEGIADDALRTRVDPADDPAWTGDEAFAHGALAPGAFAHGAFANEPTGFRGDGSASEPESERDAALGAREARGIAVAARAGDGDGDRDRDRDRVTDSDAVGAEDPADPHAGDIGTGESAIDYFSTRRGTGFLDRHRALASFLVLALLVAIAVQWIVAQRSAIAARVPSLAPAMVAALAPFGLRIEPPRELESLTIESFELRASSTPDVLEMSALLRNRAAHAVGWPSMQLTLTDPANRVLVRKVIGPDEYLRETGAAASKGVPPRAEWPLRLALEARDLQPAGYTVLLFYP